MVDFVIIYLSAAEFGVLCNIVKAGGEREGLGRNAELFLGIYDALIAVSRDIFFMDPSRVFPHAEECLGEARMSLSVYISLLGEKD